MSASAGAGGGATFVELLRRTRDFERHAPSEGVLLRANRVFSASVQLALYTQDCKLALETYYDAETLPSTATVAGLGADGYRVNGPLAEWPSITLLYKGVQTYLCKYLSPVEMKRAEAFKAALAGAAVPHVVDFELRHVTHEGRVKDFMIMPRLASTLEPMPALSDDDVSRLWVHMRDALEAVHVLGFAHMDVKPSNICVDGRGDFVLIDLGSIARFEQLTSSTWPYVPSDLHPLPPSERWTSSADVDWWMLAVTLAEKGCGEAGLVVGTDAVRVSRTVLRDHLEAHLRGGVWDALRGKLLVE